MLRKEDAVDFDDLLLLVWKLLSTHKDIRAALQQRYQYIHVDEYQDTNKVQYEIVRLLAGEKQNVFCVGDLDQNVYSWRGATIDNILQFEKDFPNATTIRLEQNYRSTNTIVTVSNEIIKKNRRRKEKTLFTTQPDGEKIALIMGYDERNEAERVVEKIAALEAKGVPGHEIAVLYRANFQSRVLEDACLSSGLAYRVLGIRFFDRKEVKDLLAYVRAALNPESWADIERVINTPTRGIGKVTVEKLRSGGLKSLTGHTHKKVATFYDILKHIRGHALGHTASETLAYALTVSTIEQSLSGKTEEDQERLENVKELVSLAAQRYDTETAPEGLLRLLEDAALATDQDELDHRTDHAPRNAINLMTIHAAKGLEFTHVFVTGLEDGLFPHERLHETNTVDDEEERRLFYVALTRAKEKVHLAYAQVRTVFGQRLPRMPSEFVLDIDERYLEVDANQGNEGSRVVYLD
jgi:DNA helicase-2/ATP-dependent DNA helicase PcrA